MMPCACTISFPTRTHDVDDNQLAERNATVDRPPCICVSAQFPDTALMLTEGLDDGLDDGHSVGLGDGIGVGLHVGVTVGI